jgi:CDP-paratose 2-epimerase
MAESIAGKKMETVYRDAPRTGDHIWWVSGFGKFKCHYPEWKITHDVRRIMEEIHEAVLERG